MTDKFVRGKPYNEYFIYERNGEKVIGNWKDEINRAYAHIDKLEALKAKADEVIFAIEQQSVYCEIAKCACEYLETANELG